MEVHLYTDYDEPQLINHHIFTRVCEECVWGGGGCSETSVFSFLCLCEKTLTFPARIQFLVFES